MTTRKNSGILRYTFGSSTSRAGQDPAFLEVTAVPQVVFCLGAGTDGVTPDQDDQLFGPSPGHAAAPDFLGVGALVAQDTDFLTAQEPHANGYIPGGTKVHAYFIVTDPLSVGLVAVQTQVIQSQVRKGGVVVDANGPSYIAAIRVGVIGYGDVAPAIAGQLVVELQHSEHDIPGIVNQDQDVLVVPNP